MKIEYNTLTHITCNCKYYIIFDLDAVYNYESNIKSNQLEIYLLIENQQVKYLK